MKRTPQLSTFIVNPDIDAYLERLTPAGDEILVEMEQYAERNGFPIVGPLVGRFLFQLAVVSGAKYVMELGSGFGYSAYWFTKALGGEGSVVFTDTSADNARMASEYFRRAGMIDRLEVITGEALSALRESRGGFDIIFNDIDKEYYPLVVDAAYDKLRQGGILITDNVLWSGRVLTDDASPGTQGVREFTRLLLEHRGFYTSIIPLRDGISVSVKL